MFDVVIGYFRKKNNNNFEKPEKSRIDEIHGVFFFFI
jgi:hypothetical protein